MSATQTRETITFAKQITRLDERAGFARATEIAAENGGALPSKAEFIQALKDPKQYEQFRGDWYWLRDAGGLNISGYAKIDYDKGDIVKVSEDEYRKLPKEQRAYAYKGSGPLALGVDYYYGRLYLSADDSPEDAARVAFVKLDGSPIAKAFRIEKGEMLEVTLPDGQKMQIDASAAKVVKRR